MSPIEPRQFVFVDTSAYFAASNRQDDDYDRAHAILIELVDKRCQLVTSNFILAELHALLLTRINREIALRVLHEIESSNETIVIRVSEVDEKRARMIITQYRDKHFSLTDATCFAIMERLGITHAFSFDRNFAQYGWAIIRPAS